MLRLEQCWRAILRRDPRADGKYVFGVTTTGVYCRPSCPARRPLRRHVRLYATPEAAERAGLRACRRCRPQAPLTPPPGVDWAALARRVAGALERPWPESALAAAAGVTPAVLRRACRRELGLTPRELAEAARLGRFKAGLRAHATVAAATYDAGFGSSSRVYERAAARLGMTPATYRQRGAGMAIEYLGFATRFGRMTLGATARGLCFAHFGDDGEAALRREFPRARLLPATARHEPWRSWRAALRQALRAGPGPALAQLPLELHGTAFQLRVWRSLRRVPAGATRTYAAVAAALGAPRAARAVARACAANRIALLIPCHRVVPQSGHSGGYRWGEVRKRMLLKAESSR
jgi:AraC family transcriptional regulator of adaptative response/methylated-DNA-[protein]-cysteine methyltransferase